MSGRLFVVATPIGNLDDLTRRAESTLRECDVIVAEDTRRTRKLLSHLGIEGKRTIALHASSTEHEVERVADLLDERDIALVTDAGTPGVSDPGDALVRAAIARGKTVIPIPGPSAVVAALSASGLGSGGGFRFVGFLPVKGRARAEALSRIASEAEPVVLFESPQRMHDTLRDLADAAPTRMACVAREMTKVHEEMIRGALSDLAAREGEWIGEAVIVLGRHDVTARETIDDRAIDARIREGFSRGEHAKTIAERVAAWSGRSKRDIYERVIRAR